MKKESFGAKSLLVGLLITAFSFNGLPALGQDLVAMNDISGGSSVFVFRRSAKAAPKRFSTVSRTTRTKAQIRDVAVRVKKQYDTQVVNDPGRTRAKVVAPEGATSARTMPKEQASRVFAGVGEYYIDHGMLDEAIERFNDAIDLDPKNTSAHMGLSDAFARKGNELVEKDQATGAKKYFEDSLKENPKNAAAYFGLGGIFAVLEQNPAAITNYEKALENDKNLTEIYAPLGILYFQAGEIAKADTMLTKALATSDGTAETQLFLGQIRYSQNRNDEALAAFQKAESIDSNNAEAFYRAGEALTRMQRTKDAMAAYQRAVTIKPAYFEANLGLALADFELEDYPGAITAYKAALKQKNDNWETYAGLADAYRLNNNFNDAQANYNLATVFLTRNPNFNKEDAAEIYNKIGYVIGRQCEINTRSNIQCGWPSAIEALGKAVALTQNPLDYANLGWVYYNAARVEIDAGRAAAARPTLELAKTNLQKALTGNPAIVDGVLQNLGAVQIDLGDFAGAVESLKPVVEHRNDWNFSKYALGTAYFKINDFDNAAKWFRAAVDGDPNYLAALRSLGYAELKRKNGKELKKVIDRLKKLSPTDAERLELAAKVAKLG